MTKDKIFNWRFCLCCGLFIWFIVNLLQGIFTEIQEDEAYYALFGEHLAWGYFDHPPMVALMTFLSSHLFSGTLGVRFCTIIASCLSLFVMWKLSTYNSQLTTDSQLSTLNSTLLFFTIACSILIVNLYGFVTTPDSALILFSALFLLVYQNYLKDSSWKNALLMGLMMALMIYSKYHAFLFLGLIVLSNLKLLKDGKFYVACLLALALLMPHINWQINNGFPSFRYHLSGRSEPFRWSYFLEYLPNQLLVFNPFVFGAVIYIFVKHKPKAWIASVVPPSQRRKAADTCVIASEAKQSRATSPQDTFERGLRFILVGFFFFFWLMAFRGHVEPHWTAVCTIPAVVLIYRKTMVDNKLMKYIKRCIMPSLLLVVAVRIALLTPVAASFGFCHDRARYETIASEAGNHPVVFQGSFQQPALYHYFTGNESSTLCCYYDRKTQYDLWQFDTAWIGKPVMVVGRLGLTEHFQTANRLVTEFQIVNRDEKQPMVFRTNDTIRIDFSIYNPCPQPIDFQQGMELKLLLLDDNKVRYGFYEPIGLLQPHETYRGQFTVVLGPETMLGKNHLLLGIGDQIAIFADTKNAVNVLVASP